MKNILLPTSGLNGLAAVNGVNDGFTSLQQNIGGFLSKSVAGSGDITLTADESYNGIIKLTGALTGNKNVIVPAAAMKWNVMNATTGAFSLTFKTAAGTGIVVTQNSAASLLCDGTNVISAGNSIGGVVPEYGTWTGYWEGSGGGTVAAYSARTGYYSKFDKLVLLSSYIDISNSSGPTGSYLLFKGIPYPINNSFDFAQPIAWINNFGVSVSSVGFTKNNNTSLFLTYIPAAGGTGISIYTPADMPASGPDVEFNLIYLTS